MANKNRERPLEKLGIPAGTSIPDDVLTPAKSKAVRFNLTSPGYSYDDVETYKEEVDKALDYYAETIHEKDLHIHKLDEEMARQETDFLNLRQENEILIAKKDITQANVDDSEVAALLSANKKLSQENVQLTAAAAELQQRFDELETWANNAEKHVENIERENQTLREQLQGNQNGDVPAVDEVPLPVPVDEVVLNDDYESDTVDFDWDETESIAPEEPRNSDDEANDPEIKEVLKKFPGLTEDDLR